MTIITTNARIIKNVTAITPKEWELHYTCLDELGEEMSDFIVISSVAAIIP